MYQISFENKMKNVNKYFSFESSLSCEKYEDKSINKSNGTLIHLNKQMKSCVGLNQVLQTILFK